MKWKEEYSTGVDKIDEQHRMIFRIVEDFRITLDEGNGKDVYSMLLNLLNQYCENHFSFEENCMNKHRCPVAKRNKHAHTELLNVMSQFQKKYISHGYKTTDAYLLVDTVDNWFKEHICDYDIHLKQCVNKSADI